MRYLSFVTILTLFFYSLTSAQTITRTNINGVVIDKTTGKPVEYANIGIEGTFVGAASDKEGQFGFIIPPTVTEGSLYASAVGYKTVKLSVKGLPQTDTIIIEMHPQAYDIGEVDINAQSLVLYRVLRDASRKIEENYISKPYSQKAYYKTIKKINDSVQRTREAEVELYDASGYVREKKEQEYKNRRYRFLEVRKDFDVISLSDGMTRMDELLDFDIVRTSGNILDEEYLQDFDLSLDQITEYEGDSVWVINYSIEKPDLSRTGDYYVTSYSGKLYINKNDYAVVKNETWVTASDYSRHGRSIATTEESENGWLPVSIQYNFTVVYKKHNDFYSIAYIKSERNNRWKSEFGEEKVVSYESFLLPTELETESPTQIDKREYFVNKPFNAEFWRTYYIND